MLKRIFATIAVLGLLALPALAQDPIEVGQEIEGTLAESGPSLYALQLKAGEVVAITLTSDAFDAYLELSNDVGDIVASDDDSAGSFNSRIIFTPEADGLYVITARSFSSGAGAFTLSVARFELTSVTPGTPVEFTAGEQCSFVFGFEGAAGDVVSIGVDVPEDTFYLSFNLVMPSGGIEYSDYTVPVLPRYELLESGTYRIEINLDESECSNAATYTLNVDPSERLVLGEAPISFSLDSVERLSLTVPEGGASYRVSIAVSSPDRSVDATFSNDLSFEDRRFSFSGINAITVDVTLNQSGEYSLDLRSAFDFAEVGPIEVTVSAVAIDQ